MRTKAELKAEIAALTADRDEWKRKYDELVAAIVKAMQEQQPPASGKPIVGIGFNGHGTVQHVSEDVKINALDVVPFKHGRIDCEIGDSAEHLVNLCNIALGRGVKPLIVPTGVAGMSEQQAYDWVAARVPALKGKALLEWGNEDYFAWGTTTSVSASAGYARSARGAARAGAAAGVKVLVQAGGAYYDEVVPALKATCPDIGSYAGGWTMHPYWPDYKTVIPNVQAQIAGMKNPHIWITEVGFSTDNGRGPLNPDNYGWNRNLTYQGAADILAEFWDYVKTRVYAVYLFQLVDQYESGANLSRESYFGTVRWSGGRWSSPCVDKGNYSAVVRRMISEGAS